MTKFAKIENGAVVSVIVSNAPFAGHDVQIPGNQRVAVGSPYANGEFAVEAVQPKTVAKPLERIDFVRLCMAAGGMTPELLASAKKAPQLEALWIMLEMSDQVHKDAPEVPAGLASLETLGFLPTGAQAVLDAWPLL